MVGVLLTVTTLAVLQLALALLVRNTVLDAASEGATVRRPGRQLARRRCEAHGRAHPHRDRRRRTPATSTPALGSHLGVPAIVVTVRAPLPVLGLIGPTGGIEVSGHAPVETLE